MAVVLSGSDPSLSRTANLPSITNFTVMCWFLMASDLESTTILMAIGNPGADQAIYVAFGFVAGSLQLDVDISGGGGGSGTTISLNTWYHFAITRSGTGAGQTLVYLNGILDITPTNTSTPTASGIWWGTYPGLGVPPIDGRYAGLMIYDSVLTAADIQQQMRMYRPVITTNLNVFAPCVELTLASNVLDLSGNGRNLTLAGTNSVADGPPIAWAPWSRLHVEPLTPAVILRTLMLTGIGR
jgi:hypothetical protein